MGHRQLRSAVLGFFLSVAGACSDGTAPQAPDGGDDPELPGDFAIRAVQVASGFDSPVHLAAPISDPRLFVVEQTGRIRIIRNGTLLSTPFLDIRDRVVAGGERGLLSVAFHPEYASNGFFYVNYTAGAETRIERYRVSQDPDRADPASGVTVITIGQPYANHNGGLIEFGPDGYLYVGMGDGGSAGDPHGHGQNTATLLGALLRLDVTGTSSYRIPPTNPFVGVSGARPEIWAVGLRNPWRFSFDRIDGMLYVADVGQNSREEVNARDADQPGLNYGWNRMEGSACFQPASGCDRSNLVLPVLEYPNGSDGCSVTGGHVYRGAAMPELAGHYFYGDYCGGWVRSFRLVAGSATDHREWDLGALGNITSFGVDAGGELYVVTHQGRIYRIER